MDFTFNLQLFVGDTNTIGSVYFIRFHKKSRNFTFTLINYFGFVFMPFKEHNISDPIKILTPLTEMLWAFVMIFIFCEHSEQMIIEFDAFNQKLGQCTWYSLPPEMQRMYLIFISNTQQLKAIQGYGGILCTRDTFKKVIFPFHIYHLSDYYVLL